MLNYEEVPTNILTGKDLDYLSDIFAWNYMALKKTNSDVEEVLDQEIVNLFDKAIDLFDENVNSTLNILESRGEEYE